MCFLCVCGQLQASGVLYCLIAIIIQLSVFHIYVRVISVDVALFFTPAKWSIFDRKSKKGLFKQGNIRPHLPLKMCNFSCLLKFYPCGGALGGNKSWHPIIFTACLKWMGEQVSSMCVSALFSVNRASSPIVFSTTRIVAIYSASCEPPWDWFMVFDSCG